MQDKISELKVLVQNDRRIWFGIGFLLLAIIIVLSAGGSDDKRRRSSGSKLAGSDGRPVAEETEAYQDLIIAIQNDQKVISKIVEDNRVLLDRSRKDRRRDRERYSAIFERLIDQNEAIVEDLEKVKADSRKEKDAQFNPQVATSNIGGDKGESFGDFTKAIVEPPPPPPPAPLRTSFISPGDLAPVRLLTGVAAPVDGTPYPVMFKVDGPITGPDGSSLDIGEARLIAAAQGSETDSRVIYRLTELAIRHQDGRRSVVKVDGWIVGEDGVRGMGGKLKDNLTDTLGALATLSSGLALSDRLQEKADNIQVLDSQDIDITQGDVDSALTLGITETFQTMAGIIVDRFQNQIPVVEVLSGRQVVAIFSQGTEIELLIDGDDDDFFDDSSLS